MAKKEKLMRSAKQSQAFEEVALLQTIIGRQDELKAKCKGLAVTLFSAITVAFMSQELLKIEALDYVAFSFALIILFLGIESVYGVTEMRSEDRVSNIEKYLRGENTEYGGPAICESLHVALNKQDLFRAVKRERTYLLYVALAVMTVLIAILADTGTNS